MMSELKPQERRQQRTRDLILKTALELVKEQGIDKWSLREIARRIDYSPSGLYEYFDSKDDILYTLWGQIGERFRAYLESVSQDLPPEEYLLQLGLAYVRFARDYPDYFMIWFSMVRSPVASFESLDNLDPEPSFMILVHGVQRAIDAGLLHTEEAYGATEISYCIWSLVHGMSMLQVTYLADFEMDFTYIDRKSLISLLEGLSGG
jgi:AcrR family transcriptional regulator